MPWKQRNPMARGTTPMGRGTSSLKRGRIKPRRFSKEPSVEGDSERTIRDECDQLVRDILVVREEYYCIVCGVPGDKEELHPGHYITRKVLALRWDLKNVWPQCNEDNREHNTRPQWYRSMLVMEIGEREVCKLEWIAKENPRVEYTDLLAIRDGLRSELARLKAEAILLAKVLAWLA